ncbi:Photosystem II reaction center protein T (modular protein) [Planktothrix sp. PCC 11201]|jgi:photosystem II PsbT protein|nr:Photosystem II reaction center protein T (modular protein) [Planktothrix sp. PCC 11201]
MVDCYKTIGLGKIDMESVAYILVLTLALGVLFFAIAFREPPRIGK